MLISIASIGESSKRARDLDVLLDGRAAGVGEEARLGEIERRQDVAHDVLDAGILQADRVEHAVGGFRRRDAAGCRGAAAPVVPLSTIAPASRLEKPSTRVYSSPKPTQPDSSTIGRRELQAAEVDGELGGGSGDAVGASWARLSLKVAPMFHVILYRARDPAEHRQRHPAVRQHRLPAAPDRAAGFRAGRAARCGAPGSTTTSWPSVSRHADLMLPGSAWRAPRVFAVETGAGRCYARRDFRPGDALLFGSRDHAACRARCCDTLPPEQMPVDPDARRQPQPQPLQRRGGGRLRGLAAAGLQRGCAALVELRLDRPPHQPAHDVGRGQPFVQHAVDALA